MNNYIAEYDSEGRSSPWNSNLSRIGYPASLNAKCQVQNKENIGRLVRVKQSSTGKNIK